MKIINFTIENFMNIKAGYVEFDKQKNIVKVTGENASGKSSLLKGLWSLFQGPSAFPVEPITHGEDAGCLMAKLGDLTVTRKLTKKEDGKIGQTLIIKAAGKSKALGSPQAILDSLFTRIALNPVAFVEMTAVKREKELLQLTGREDDLEKIKAQREEKYAERSDVNRVIKQLEGKVAGMPHDDGSIEVPITELIEKVAEEQTRVMACERESRRIDTLTQDIDNLDDEIKKTEEKCVTLTEERKHLNEELDELVVAVVDAPPSQLEELQEQMRNIEKTNEQARANAKVKAWRDELRSELQRERDLTKKIEAFDAERAQILAESPLPANIDIDNGIIRIDGTPFDDRSTSEQIMTAINVGIAQNPELRLIVIPRGESLDEETITAIEELADEKDLLVIIESVSADSAGGIHIEDGCIINNTLSS